MKCNTSQRGFTLLEMLVAIAIFAMISLSAYQLMSAMMDARTITASVHQRMQSINTALVVLEQDFRHIVDRGLRIDGRMSSQSLFSDENMLESDDEAISFTRSQWRNPQYTLPRSELQKISYRLKEHRLERLYHYTLDPAENTEPEIRPLLDKITQLEFRFFINGSWQESFTEQNTFPQGVMVRLQLEDIGEILRVFSLPEPWGANE
ncbi:type II secretion system minor pseudopilin GspJ [Parendozoicomonas haliclonae]|nr:type II secretion system minor pseudopilin GspJ [Parendozoicomonas haliclonae]